VAGPAGDRSSVLGGLGGERSGESYQEKRKRLYESDPHSNFITSGKREHLTSSLRVRYSGAGGGGTVCRNEGMKKYVRAVLDDLKSKTKKKDNPVMPQDLNNQVLSKDPRQKVRQLDYQAQKDEERQKLG
jgi:hypothetical protein